MKVKVCPLDGDTDYFDIVVGVQQGDTLAPYFFIIFLDYVLRTFIDLMKENGFKQANTQLAKTWIAIDRLSVIWMSNLTVKIKRSFFPSSGHVDTALWMHYMDALHGR